MNSFELKLKLAKMLPDKIDIHDDLSSKPARFMWKINNQFLNEDGWLQVCHFIEKRLTPNQQKDYHAELVNLGPELYTEIFADWYKKANALIKVTNT